MPLKDLLDALQSEANEERTRLQTGAEAEAEAILVRAREEAARAREEVLRAHAPATEREGERRVALARLEAARLRREAREAAFSLLFAEAGSRLAAARDEPRYPDAMRALLQDALAALPDAATARVNPADEALASGLARGLGAPRALRVVADAGVGGGVMLESEGGRVVRNTLEERLSNAEPYLRPWYGRRLAALSGGAR